MTYHYGSEYTTLADSITYQLPLNGLTGKYFSHTVTTEGQNTVIEYAEASTPSGPVTATYSFTLDNCNRLVNNRYYQQGGYLWSNTNYYYNSFGKPDSIVTESFYQYASADTTGYKSFYSYDTLNRQIQVIGYQANSPSDNNFQPAYKITHTYSETAQPYQYPLQIIEFIPLSIIYDMDYMLLFFDSEYPPQSTTHYLWSYMSQSWDYSPYLFNFWNDENYMVFSTNYPQQVYRFWNSGLYIGNSQNYGDTGSELSITWEYYTPNEDQSQPAIPFSLTAYPNPFRNILTINSNSKTAIDNVSIYNLKGQLIRSWNDVKAAGLTWDGKDSNNRAVSSGVYLIRARQQQQTFTAKVIKY